MPIADPEPIDGALPAPWWRRRRVLPWAIAAVAVLAAAIGIGIGVGRFRGRGVGPLQTSRTTHSARQPGPASIPVDDDVPVRYDLSVSDFVSYGAYGPLQIWSTTKLENRRCIAVVGDNHISVFECTAPSVDTIADFNIDSDQLPPTPSGELSPCVRFILHDEVVDVYRPKEEGEFYGIQSRRAATPELGTHSPTRASSADDPITAPRTGLQSAPW